MIWLVLLLLAVVAIAAYYKIRGGGDAGPKPSNGAGPKSIETPDASSATTRAKREPRADGKPNEDDTLPGRSSISDYEGGGMPSPDKKVKKHKKKGHSGKSGRTKDKGSKRVEMSPVVTSAVPELTEAADAPADLAGKSEGQIPEQGLVAPSSAQEEPPKAKDGSKKDRPSKKKSSKKSKKHSKRDKHAKVDGKDSAGTVGSARETQSAMGYIPIEATFPNPEAPIGPDAPETPADPQEAHSERSVGASQGKSHKSRKRSKSEKHRKSGKSKKHSKSRHSKIEKLE